MEDLKKRIDTLLEVAERWLSNDNEYLMHAAGRTVEEGYFAEHDVRFALKAAKQSFTREALERWAEAAGITDEKDAQGQNVLCLHAGNLPLVGFQNALATLLSGARYSGKISRKDPYLLPTFLNEVKKTDVWGSMDVQWSHRLDDFVGMRNDAILFAGSESSVPGVKKAIQDLNLSIDNTRYLIRTAHFSMAYFDQKNEQSIDELVASIFRYNGKGCRSVAVVVSPFSLDEMNEDLSNAVESFRDENPPQVTPPAKLKQQFAYNKAVERPQIWLNNFLLQEGGLELDQDYVCYWIQGDESTVSEVAEQFDNDLQSIYVTRPDVEIPGFEGETEPLAEAQQPPIDWEPDGVDTLHWLIK